MKANAADIRALSGRAEPPRECGGRELISDFYNRDHQRNQPVLEHPSGVLPAKADAPHAHRVRDGGVFLADGGEKSENDGQGNDDFIG